MASALQKLARNAGRIFANTTKQQQLIDRKKILADNMNSITCDDILFDRIYLQHTGEYRREPGIPPVMYVQLWEDEHFTMGVFILKHGVRLPLHDHPDMHGFIKVIHGKALIESYNMYDALQPPQHILSRIQTFNNAFTVKCAEKLPDQIVQPSDDTCCLTPWENNVHEIWAVDGPMAFLDILSPPYDHTTGARECHYYRDVKSFTTGSDNALRYLIRIEQPNDFWCGTTDYLGPELDPYEDEEDNDSSGS